MPPKKTTIRQVHARLPEDLHRRITAQAAEFNISTNSMVNILLTEALNSREPEPGDPTHL